MVLAMTAMNRAQRNELMDRVIREFKRGGNGAYQEAAKSLTPHQLGALHRKLAEAGREEYAREAA